MALDPSRYAELKADALAQPSLANAISLSDWPAIANYYNEDAGGFVVWKSLVPLNQIGMALDFNAVSGLTTADSTRVQLIFQVSPAGINPYLADRRAAFDNIFSGVSGATTRAALLALWKRFANRVEKLFATGTGSDASPATLAHEGQINGTDVQKAFGA
jgi:hypothetical protein